MFKCGQEYVNASLRLSCRARAGCKDHVLSAVPHGLREGEGYCYGSLTAGLWQPQPVHTIPLRAQEGKKEGGH